MKALKQLFLALVLLSLLSNAKADNPIVCLNTSLGEICIELFKQQAPVTVENFLGYVQRGDYDNTIIHRLVRGFVMQGGGYSLIKQDGGEQLSLIQVERQPSILNEFGISNTRGTIAMAKLSGDPNSATSEWFVNLADNSSNLDAQNEGFSVFGEVIEGGMSVVDAIEGLTLFDFGGVLTTTPTINLGATDKVLQPDHFVYIHKARLIEKTIHAIGTFTDNRLQLPVDAGSLGKLNVEMVMSSVEPNITFRLDASSLAPLDENVTKFGFYNEETLVLEVESVNIQGGLTVRNVVLQMTDPEQLVFTLVSVDGL